jgi:hypothetical protein
MTTGQDNITALAPSRTATPKRGIQPTFGQKIRGWISNPWGTPRSLVVITWLYLFISIVPVIVAVQFSFNDGRSVTTWQGFNLTKWYFADPAHSVWTDPTRRRLASCWRLDWPAGVVSSPAHPISSCCFHW